MAMNRTLTRYWLLAVALLVLVGTTIRLNFVLGFNWANIGGGALFAGIFLLVVGLLWLAYGFIAHRTVRPALGYIILACLILFGVLAAILY